MSAYATKSKAPQCDIRVGHDRCEEEGPLQVVIDGRTFNVCAEHRRMIEDMVPPTPQPWDEPVVLVRAEYERWRAARRKHEQLGDLDAAAACARVQGRYHAILKQLEADGPRGGRGAAQRSTPPPAAPANWPLYPKPWEVAA